MFKITFCFQFRLLFTSTQSQLLAVYSLASEIYYEPAKNRNIVILVIEEENSSSQLLGPRTSTAQAGARRA